MGSLFYVRWFMALLGLATVGFVFGWFMEVPGALKFTLAILGAVYLLLPLSRHGDRS